MDAWSLFVDVEEFRRDISFQKQQLQQRQQQQVPALSLLPPVTLVLEQLPPVTSETAVLPPIVISTPRDLFTGEPLERDVKLAWRFMEPGSSRRRNVWREQDLYISAIFEDTNEWVRISIFAQDAARFPWLRPNRQQQNMYAEGRFPHLTLVTTTQLNAGLSSQDLQDVQAIKLFFGNQRLFFSVRVRYITGSTPTGGHNVTIAAGGALGAILLPIDRLRAPHHGTRWTISL